MKEARQKKHTSCDSICMECSEWANPQRYRLVVARGWGRQEKGVTAKRYGVPFGGNENV